MTRSLQQRRGLGLALIVALGLMLFTAQGAVAAEWRIKGAKLTTNATYTGNTHTETNFLVPSMALEILCAKHTIDEAVILPNGEAHGSLLLTECKTWQNGQESKFCKPFEPILAAGGAKPFLHNALTYLRVEPPPGGVYAIATFGGLCALPEENEVTGTAVAECLNAKLESKPKLCEEEAVTHYGREAPHGLFPEDRIFFGENAVTYDGVGFVKLSGANEGWPASAFG